MYVLVHGFDDVDRQRDLPNSVITALHDLLADDAGLPASYISTFDTYVMIGVTSAGEAKVPRK